MYNDDTTILEMRDIFTPEAYLSVCGELGIEIAWLYNDSDGEGYMWAKWTNDLDAKQVTIIDDSIVLDEQYYRIDEFMRCDY
jgi:hypothetical protein